MEKSNYLNILFSNSGLSLKELENITNLSRSTLYRWFRQDNLEISKTKLLIKSMGYNFDEFDINDPKNQTLKICPYEYIKVLEKQILLLEKTLSTYEKHIGKIELD